MSRLAVTERDRRLLELVSRFRLLARDQVIILAPFGSLTRANTRLAGCVRAKLLSRKLMPVYVGSGSAQALYFLGTGSGAVLGRETGSVNQQVRQVSRWDLRQVEHVIAANQVLVDFTAALQHESSAILSFRTEPELHQVFVNRSFVPDGWVAWTFESKRFNCFIEVDLHHEGLTVWRKKILEYLEYAESSLHQELFGSRYFRVLVLAKGSTRLEHLRQIAVPAGQLFLFGQIGKISHANLFSQVWQRSLGEHLIALTQA